MPLSAGVVNVMLETAIACAAGCLCLFIGWRIWKKEQITLIHAYHHKRVAEKDKKAYTEKTGKAVTLIGIGIILAAVTGLATGSAYSWALFVLCFVRAFAMIIIAQKKYNGGLF